MADQKGFRIGGLLITSASEFDKNLSKSKEEQEQLKKYVVDEINKIHEEKDGKSAEGQPNVVVKSMGAFDAMAMPFGALYAPERSKKNKFDVVTLDILRHYSNELPQAPQAVEYLVNSVFAHGYSIKTAPGKKANKQIEARVNQFLRSANADNQNLFDLIRTAFRNAIQVGDGYMEKVWGKGSDGRQYLAELYNIAPENITIQIDDELAKKGDIRVTGYVKIENLSGNNLFDQTDSEEVPPDAKLGKDDVIHIKYIDEGDAYGHTPFEKNQQITQFIMNVINMNNKKFSNEVRHSIWVKLGKNASYYDAQIFLNQYKANYLGKGNFGKPLVTYGDIEITVMDNGAEKSLDYQDFMLRIGNQHAPSLLNVSPSEIVNTDAKYANSDQGHITTTINTINPLKGRVEDLINNEIFPALEGLTPQDIQNGASATYQIVFGREAINTIYDHVDKITQGMIRGLMTINEARRIVDAQNLPPIEEEYADKLFIIEPGSGNVVFVDDVYFGGDDAEEEQEAAPTDAGTAGDAADPEGKKPKTKKYIKQLI